ncbi:MAG: putative oxidoreductase [Luteibacter sp.]|uniref:SDR family oxidoreductase n=1 Tax=Luteibacter sp. TaxID=1886636 RepID=UPI00137C587C|nr:SDR family NAD(P)-dependent oxidoreductase [Luteibacter sp.]KAF1004732.1 MAG: putative oxidoreductase [Luteibacter sp.]
MTTPHVRPISLSDNTLLITGGTSGIGRALAEAFHDLGNQVIVTGRRQALLDAMMRERPGLVGFPLDVGNPDSLARLTETLRSQFPDLNMLIANAGISQAEDMGSDDWDASVAASIVDTNIMGVLRVTAAFLPMIRKRPNAAIMATSSNLAFIPRADYPTYCASKAFLHSWLQSLRHQLRNVPVTVLELSPPYVQTELTGEHQAKDPRAMPLADYVTEVMQLLAMGRHPNGEVLVERDMARRRAEREGRYDEMYAAINPG